MISNDQEQVDTTDETTLEIRILETIAKLSVAFKLSPSINELRRKRQASNAISTRLTFYLTPEQLSNYEL